MGSRSQVRVRLFCVAGALPQPTGPGAERVGHGHRLVFRLLHRLSLLNWTRTAQSERRTRHRTGAERYVICSDACFALVGKT